LYFSGIFVNNGKVPFIPEGILYDVIFPDLPSPSTINIGLGKAKIIPRTKLLLFQVAKLAQLLGAVPDDESIMGINYYRIACDAPSPPTLVFVTGDGVRLQLTHVDYVFKVLRLVNGLIGSGLARL
jgi:hypothetical protein